MSVRRRRLTLFAVAAVLLVGLFAFYHYQSQYDQVPEAYQPLDAPHTYPGSQTSGRADGRDANSVHFVKPTGGPRANGFNPVPPTSYSASLDADRSYEQPSRDEIARRRQTNYEVVDQAASWNKDLHRMGASFASELTDSTGTLIAAPPEQRLIHFDLKGAPPKPGYLRRVMHIARTLGATGVLMEYEDMAPLAGKLSGVTAGNAYTKEQIKEILKAAKENELKVIPLVQTFGHMEFVLKIKDFKHLREVPDSPQALCPSLNESLVLIEEMLVQIMDLHEGVDITHLHIGCDEVFQMGECPRCRNTPRDDLFINHVLAVSRIVRRRWPHVRPIIWDDMLRHIDVHILQESGLGNAVDPMVWVYAPDVYRFVSPQIFEKYAAVFSTAWAAPAFKGAHGETLVVPPGRKHLENTVRWLSVMAAEGSRFKNGFAGIVLTGWQRYDHFAVLCELLPSAIPIMALCLAISTNGRMDKAALDSANSALSCPESSNPDSHRHWIDLNSDPNLYSSFSRCLFPGHQFFRLIQRLEMVQSETTQFLETTKLTRAWMTDYNIRRNYSAPLRIDELMSESSRILAGLTSVARSATAAMEDIFDDYTISEWVEQKVYPMIKQMEDLEQSAKEMRDVTVWARRPLPKLKDLQRFGVPRVTPTSSQNNN